MEPQFHTEVDIKEEPTQANRILTYTSKRNIQIELTVQKEEIQDQNYETIDLLEDFTLSNDDIEIIEDNVNVVKVQEQKDLDKTDGNENNDLDDIVVEVDDLIEEDIENVVEEWKREKEEGDVSMEENIGNSKDKELNNIIESAGIIIDLDEQTNEQDTTADISETVQDVVVTGTSDPNIQMELEIIKKEVAESDQLSCIGGRNENFNLISMQEEFIGLVRARRDALNLPVGELSNNDKDIEATVTIEVEKTDNQEEECDDVILIEPDVQISAQRNETPNSESVIDLTVDVKIESVEETFSVGNKGLVYEVPVNPENDKQGSTAKSNLISTKNITKITGSKLNSLIERIKKRKEEKINTIPKKTISYDEVYNESSGQVQLDITVTKELADSDKDLDAKKPEFEIINLDDLKRHKQSLLKDMVNENLNIAERNKDELQEEFSVNIKIEELVGDYEKENLKETSEGSETTQAEKQNHTENYLPIDISNLDDLDDDCLNVFTENIINENTENYTDLQNLEDPIFNNLGDSKPQVEIEVIVTKEEVEESEKKLEKFGNQIEDISYNEIEKTIQGLKCDAEKILDDIIKEEIRDCVKDFLENEFQDNNDNNKVWIELKIEELSSNIEIKEENKVDDDSKGSEAQNQRNIILNDIKGLDIKSHLDSISNLASIEEINVYQTDLKQYNNLKNIEFIDTAVADSTYSNITKRLAIAKEELDQDKKQLRIDELKEKEIGDVIRDELKNEGIVDSYIDIWSCMMETQDNKINEMMKMKKGHSKGTNEGKADIGLGVRISLRESIEKRNQRTSEDSNDDMIEEELRNLIDKQLQMFAKEVDNTSDEDEFNIHFESLGKGTNVFASHAGGKQELQAAFQCSQPGIEALHHIKNEAKQGQTEVTLLNSRSEKSLLKPGSKEKSEHKAHRRHRHRDKSKNSNEKSKHHSGSKRKSTSNSKSEAPPQSDIKTDTQKGKGDSNSEDKIESKNKHDEHSSKHTSKSEEKKSGSKHKSKSKYKNSDSKSKSECKSERDNPNLKHKSDTTHINEKKSNSNKIKSEFINEQKSYVEQEKSDSKHKSDSKNQHDSHSESKHTSDCKGEKQSERKYKSASKKDRENDSKHESKHDKHLDSKLISKSKDRDEINKNSQNDSESNEKTEISESRDKLEKHTNKINKFESTDKDEKHSDLNKKSKPKDKINPNGERKNSYSKHKLDSANEHKTHSVSKDEFVSNESSEIIAIKNFIHDKLSNSKYNADSKDEHDETHSNVKNKTIANEEQVNNSEHKCDPNDKSEKRFHSKRKSVRFTLPSKDEHKNNSDSNSKSVRDKTSDSEVQSVSRDKPEKHTKAKPKLKSNENLMNKNCNAKVKHENASNSKHEIDSKNEQDKCSDLKKKPESKDKTCSPKHKYKSTDKHEEQTDLNNKSDLDEEQKNHTNLNLKSECKDKNEKHNNSKRQVKFKSDNRKEKSNLEDQHEKDSNSKHQSKLKHETQSNSKNNSESTDEHKKSVSKHKSKLKERDKKLSDSKHEAESKEIEKSDKMQENKSKNVSETKTDCKDKNHSDLINKRETKVNHKPKDKHKISGAKQKSKPIDNDKNQFDPKHESETMLKFENSDIIIIINHKSDSTNEIETHNLCKTSEFHDDLEINCNSKLRSVSKRKHEQRKSEFNDKTEYSDFINKLDSKREDQAKSNLKKAPKCNNELKPNDKHKNVSSKHKNNTKSKQNSKCKTKESDNSELVQSSNVNSTSDSKNKRKKRSDTGQKHKQRRHSEPQDKSLSKEKHSTDSVSSSDVNSNEKSEKMSQIRSPKAEQEIKITELQDQNQSTTKYQTKESGHKRKSDSKIEQKGHSDSKRIRLSKESNTKNENGVPSISKSKIMTKRLLNETDTEKPNTSRSKIDSLKKKDAQTQQNQIIKTIKHQEGQSDSSQKPRKPEIVRPPAKNTESKSLQKQNIKTQQMSTKPEEKSNPQVQLPSRLTLIPPELDQFVFTPDYKANKKLLSIKNVN